MGKITGVDFGEYKALDDLSLEMNKGEIFGFLGLNGAGKTTTIKMLLSMLRPTSGSLQMLGQKVDAGRGSITGSRNRAHSSL